MCYILGGSGSSFHTETLNSGEDLHHRRKFNFGFDDPGRSHLVSVEGKYHFSFVNIKSFK